MENLVDRPVEKDMKESYLDYAMSVIVGRALPDVRDGLKPVHRRILYTMYELGSTHDKQYKKSARVVGDCLGRFHPHGDIAIYDTLVRMAQPFSLRYTLVDGQGNFGCFTKDTKISLCDGRNLSFGELIKEDEEGRKNYTFTIDQNNDIKIGKIDSPRLTRKNAEIMKVILDDGEEIKCTLNHRFMLRNGSFKEAKDLKMGDSLMPLYSRLSTEEDDPNAVGYRMLYNPSEENWVYAHHLADEWNLNHGVYPKGAGRIRHHINFNKSDNSPENIRRLNWKEHWKIHFDLTSKKHKNDPAYRKKLEAYSLLNTHQEITPEIYDGERTNNCIPKLDNALGYFNDFQEIVEHAKKYNHKVKAVEFTQEREDVYDLTVDGTHNFALASRVFVHNSLDGDAAAAMRYTEVRMEKIAEEMLQDIDKETVDFIPNFDGTMKEPLALPSKIPNLIINGSSGIAVGMATNVPPHNLSEIIDGLVAIIEGAGEDAVLGIVKAPDFPTGGLIVGKMGILEAYKTGKGILRVRGKAEVKKDKNGKDIISITEIPYQITKTAIIEAIVDAVKNKRIEGISGIHDRSDRQGIELIVELKRDAVSGVALNQLYAHTPLETTFGVINLVLVNNEPKLLGLYEILRQFIEFRKEIVTKRCKFELKVAEERAHILEGLRKALENIDSVVAFLRTSKNIEEARAGLMKNYLLSEKQANAILDMKLQRLIALEREKIQREYEELLKTIGWLKSVLADVSKVLVIIKDELLDIKKKYGDVRRTEVIEVEGERTPEELIPNEDVVVTITNRGYIKRVGLAEYKAQRRGGKGVVGTGTKEEDIVSDIIVTRNHNYMLFFTNKGRVYWLKAYEIPEGGRYATGKPIVNLLQLQEHAEKSSDDFSARSETQGVSQRDEKVTSWVSVNQFTENEYLSMATKNGIIKRISLDNFARPRKTGIIAITLKEGDELVGVVKTDGKQDLLIATKKGQAIRFKEEEAREIGRTGRGVIGIRFKEGEDAVVGIGVCNKPTILTITESGYGKRTHVDEYRVQGRGGSGVINIKTEGRNGNVVGVKSVDENDEVLVMSSKGQTIRSPVTGISVIGRNTAGVRIIRLEEGEKVASFTAVSPEAPETQQSPAQSEGLHQQSV